MAKATDRHSGEDEAVYVAAAAPADPADPTDPAYEVLGLRTTSGLNAQSPQITISDADGATSNFGPAETTKNLGWNQSLEGDPAQLILRDAAFSSPKDTVWVLITSNVVGERFQHFSGQVGNYTEQGDAGSPHTGGCQIGLDGPPTFGTIAA